MASIRLRYKIICLVVMLYWIGTDLSSSLQKAQPSFSGSFGVPWLMSPGLSLYNPTQFGCQNTGFPNFKLS